jgi:hypothetical protein
LGLTLLVLAAGVAIAQAPYAPPSVTVDRVSDLGGDRGLFRLTLAITAGADGAPAGFSVQWMKKSDYDALGGWAAEGHPALKYCQCYGPYTLNDWAGSPVMGAGGVSYLQLGDLNDESGLYGNDYDQLLPGTEYVIRAYTEGDGNGDPSTFSNEVTTSTLTSLCTQGFWNTHGPGLCQSGNNADVWPASCFPMFLGTVSYTQAQICSILLANVSGNGLISLAHQLITAKLNGCSTSDLTPIASTIAAADALIGGLVVPPVGGGYLSPGSTSSLTETLDDYNNGLLGGVADCPTDVKTTTTWGRLKVLYR